MGNGNRIVKESGAGEAECVRIRRSIITSSHRYAACLNFPFSAFKTSKNLMQSVAALRRYVCSPLRSKLDEYMCHWLQGYSDGDSQKEGILQPTSLCP